MSEKISISQLTQETLALMVQHPGTGAYEAASVAIYREMPSATAPEFLTVRGEVLRRFGFAVTEMQRPADIESLVRDALLTSTPEFVGAAIALLLG